MGSLSASVVLDNGTFNIKAGFSGEYYPSVVCRTFSDNENTVRPIQDGIIKNWDVMEKIWGDIFKYKLNINCTEHPILIAETPLNSNEDREHMTEIVFETFGFPAIYICNEACLSLHHSGRTTGLVVHCSYETTHAVPVYQSYPLTTCVTSSKFGGSDVTENLTNLLSQRGFSFKSTDHAEPVRLLKEKLCYIAWDAQSESSSPPEDLKRIHKLPDGQFITVDTERFLAAEGIFFPAIFNKSDLSCQELTHKAIVSCDPALQERLYKNIIVSGGTSLLPGFAERLEKEIKRTSQSKTKVSTITPEDSHYSAWIGGSILSSIPSFQNLWFNRQEYEECGSEIIHRKCY